jgi:hypothetical protein
MVKRISSLASNEKFQVRFLVELLRRLTQWTTWFPFNEYEWHFGAGRFDSYLEVNLLKYLVATNTTINCRVGVQHYKPDVVGSSPTGATLISTIAP